MVRLHSLFFGCHALKEFRYFLRGEQLQGNTIGQSDNHVLQYAGIPVFQGDGALLHAVLIVTVGACHDDAVRRNVNDVFQTDSLLRNGIISLFQQRYGVIHDATHRCQ